MLKFAKPVVFVLALIPAALLVRAGLTGTLGVNPAETLQLETGVWALRFLLLTLVITPVRRITGWNRIIQYRRMLGLFAFFYASCHFLTYLVLDQFFAVDSILKDIVKRPFITFGVLAYALMIPLALTSTKGWIRRLGKRWQLLHRLIYVSAIAGAVHYLWKVKLAAGPPVYYAIGVGILLSFRIAWQLRSGKLLTRQRVSA
jgi:sulfoxide reductase heme-binding subunit YedZ